jgi:hypothetical protein
MHHPLRVLSESEAKLECFHDCHVHGLHWSDERFIFSLDLQYILEWIKRATSPLAPIASVSPRHGLYFVTRASRRS